MQASEDFTQLSLHFLGKACPALACGVETLTAGQRSRAFRKELIRVGEYTKDSEGLTIQVTRDDLEHWAIQFSSMKTNGVKVPIPSTHTEDPEANNGWLDEVWVEGDSLYGVITLVGDKSIEMAGKVDVSIFCPPSFVDGKGNKYSRPITHVALCTNPVVPGLSDWVALSLSHTKRKTMAIDYAKIREALGLDVGTDVNEGNVVELVLSFAKGAKTLAESEAKLKEDLALALNKVKEAKKGEVEMLEPPHPQLVKLSLDNRRLRLESLVKSGKLSPAAKAKADAVFCDEAALALSLSTDPNGANFDRFVEVLEANTPAVNLGEMTGAQVLQFSREGGEKTPSLADGMKQLVESKSI